MLHFLLKIKNGPGSSPDRLQNALALALKPCKDQIVLTLLARKASPNILFEGKVTPLMHSAKGCGVAVLQALQKVAPNQTYKISQAKALFIMRLAQIISQF